MEGTWKPPTMIERPFQASFVAWAGPPGPWEVLAEDDGRPWRLGLGPDEPLPLRQPRTHVAALRAPACHVCGTLASGRRRDPGWCTSGVGPSQRRSMIWRTSLWRALCRGLLSRVVHSGTIEVCDAFWRRGDERGFAGHSQGPKRMLQKPKSDKCAHSCHVMHCFDQILEPPTWKCRSWLAHSTNMRGPLGATPELAPVSPDPTELTEQVVGDIAKASTITARLRRDR